MPIKSISTNELVEELSRRIGVETKKAEAISDEHGILHFPDEYAGICYNAIPYEKLCLYIETALKRNKELPSIVY